MDNSDKRYLNAEEVRQEHVDVLGPELGPVYHDLYNQCLWLHVKWQQFVELYGTKPERIKLLNRTARLFFRIVHTTLWEDTLLNLARLTDPAFSGIGKNKKSNLTLQCVPGLVADETFRADIQALVDTAIAATAFARDWRNRRIAHRDFALAISTGAQPLAPASRKSVDDALKAVSRIVERLNEYYLKSDLRLELVTQTTANDAMTLLYVMRDGLEADENRRRRIRERKMEPDDLKPKAEI